MDHDTRISLCTTVVSLPYHRLICLGGSWRISLENRRAFYFLVKGCGSCLSTTVGLSASPFRAEHLSLCTPDFWPTVHWGADTSGRF